MPTINIPPDLRRRFEREKVAINPSGEYKKITVMFVDMRGFSFLLEKHNARKVLRLLDIYFRMLVSIISKHNGIVDKLIGDGLMAVWGLPEGSKRDVYNAIRAAIEIRIGMFRLIPELVSIGEVPLEIGIGIGTGIAVTGFVGPSTRNEFTLVGNCINRAARLQSLAYDNRIFIDSETASEVRSFSYLLDTSLRTHRYILKDNKAYEIEGLCEFNLEFEKLRRHPRVVVAKIAGITKLSSNRRKPVLIKSIGEGGLGIEIHDCMDFPIAVGDEALFDSTHLSLLNRESTRGYIVRKDELKGGGIFRIKTWDVGVKFIDISEELRRRLLKVFVGNETLHQLVGV